MKEISLGPDVVQLLIPQRYPLRLIDRVIGFAPGEKPSVRTQKLIAANEPVFVGHFRGLALWPGAYTIEAMGQTCNLLAVLLDLQIRYAQHEQDADKLLADLRALESMHRLDPRVHSIPPALRALQDAPQRIGMSSSVDVKLLEPVFAGQTMEMVSTLTHVQGEAGRFAVEAWSEGRPVARGSIASSIRFSLPPQAG